MKNQWGETGLFIVSWLAIECIFRGLASLTWSVVSSLRILLFTLSTSLTVCLLVFFLPQRIQRSLKILILVGVSILGFSQLSYNHYLNAYYSFNLLFTMGSRVEDYAGDFSQYFMIRNFAIFIPVLIYLLSTRFLDVQTKKPSFISWVMVWVLCIVFHLMSIQSLTWKSQTQLPMSLSELYQNPYSIEASLSQFGMTRFEIRDLVYTLSGNENVGPEEPIVILEPEPIVVKEPSLERVFDDTAWIEAMNQETNEDIKQIDAYLMSRKISPKNEMTGIFKDKNLILIMVEAFDYMAIDETLTPTLYRMSQEGYFFNHFFSPQYSCATGESEFIALTSLVPRSGICSPNTYTNNSYPTSLFNLFNQAGYTSTSFHSYSDKFYERTELHLALGSTQFYNNDDLAIKVLKGWPSDVNLMEEAIPIFTQDKPFFSFIITASTHFPYDVESTLGNRYIDTIQDVYPDLPMNVMRYKSKAMDLDKALETLISQLETQGILYDTVLVLFGDHFPLKTDKQDLLDYGNPNHDRNRGFNINTLPMMIYNTQIQGQVISEVGSTFDLTPTLANLFDLEFDPRLYFGVDLFDENQKAIVTYPSLSWNTDEGFYSVSSGKFTPFDSSNTLTEEEIERINLEVKQNSDVSYRIMKDDYYKYR